MPNLVQLDAGSYILYANNATIEAASKLYLAFNVQGKFLKDATGISLTWLDGFAKSDHSAYKAALIFYDPFGDFCIYDSTGSIFPLSTHSGAAISSLGDATRYDVLCVINDNAFLGGSDVCALIVYASGDLLGTEILRRSTASSATVGTAAGVGSRWLGGIDAATGFGSVAGTFDWAKADDDSSLSVFDSELEEGSGTSVSPSGTITGTFSWEGGAADPDHGVVTLTPSSTPLNGGSSTATVDWQDAGNASLSPQPATTWSVDPDSQAVTIDSSTGEITVVAAGTATIRATSGAVDATADITVTNPYDFTGAIT